MDSRRSLPRTPIRGGNDKGVQDDILGVQGDKSVLGEQSGQEVLAELSKRITRIEVDLASQGLTLQESGPQLIRNPSFESNSTGQPTYFSYINNSTSANTFVNNAKVRSGNHALRIQPKDDKSSFGVYQPSVSTVFGRPYTLSLYISNQTGGDVRLQLSFWDRLNNRKVQPQTFVIPGIDRGSINILDSRLPAGRHGRRGNDTARGWQKVSYTFNPNSDISLGNNYYPMIEVLGASSGNVYIDDLYLTDDSGSAIFETSSSAGVGLGSLVVDANGNIYPYTSGTGSLGIDSNRFTALYLSKGSIDKDGNMSLSGTLDVSGASTLSGALSVGGATTLNGNTTLGDASSDTLTFTGRAASNFLPTTNQTYDLGSSSLEWNNLYAKTLNISGGQSIGGNLTVTGTLGVTGATTLSSTLSVTGGITAPTSSNTINSLIINSGALSGVTGITTSGGYTQSGTTANTFTGTSTFSNATYSALFTGGNVGIGTTAPAGKLDIERATSDGGVILRLGDLGSGATNFDFSRNAGDGTLTLNGNSSTSISLFPSGGRLGIGVASPLAGLHNAIAGAASIPAGLFSGTWYTGGTATTTKPQLLIEPTGTTSTAWSTSGTGLGINAATGFAGNLIDAQVAGSSKFKISSAGVATVTNLSGFNSEINLDRTLYITSGSFKGTGIIGAGTLTINGSGKGGISIQDSSNPIGSTYIGGTAVQNGTKLTINATGTNADGARGVLDLIPGTWGAVTAENGILNVTGGTMTITGGYATQRYNLFNQPTITAASALNISSEATTLSISGPPISAGSATITNAYGLKIDSGTSVAAGVTNAFGLSVAAPTGATNNYAAVFTGGSVGIGTTAPGAQLDVVKAAGYGIRLLSNGAASYSAFGLGRTGVDFSLAVAGSASEWSSQAAQGDVVFRSESTTQKLLLGTGASTTMTILNGNVGIGTTAPTATLQVSGTTSTTGLVSLNTGAAANNTIGGNLLFSRGDSSSIIGTSGNFDFQLWTNNTEKARITSGGNVGIGTTAPSAALEVKASGTGVIAKFTSTNTTGCTLADGGTISCSSDRNLKKNIEELPYGLDTLMALNPVEFNWNYQGDGTTKSLGFIAQDVETVIPNLVTTDSSTGYKQLNTIGLVPVLAKALQDLNQRVNGINTENVIARSEERATKQSSSEILKQVQDDIKELEASISAVIANSSQTSSWGSLAVLSATSSALLTSTDNTTNAENLLVGDTLSVLGRTILSDLGVTGNINAGLLYISGIDGEINTLAGNLRLQSNGLNGLDILAGKIVIDNKGNITSSADLSAKTVSVDELKVSSQTLGKDTIKKGDVLKTILTDKVASDSSIFVTPLTKTDKVLSVDNILEKKSFDVVISSPWDKDIRFNWWIVGTK